MEKLFIFVIMWSMGALLELDDRAKMEEFLLKHPSNLHYPQLKEGRPSLSTWWMTQVSRVSSSAVGKAVANHAEVRGSIPSVTDVGKEPDCEIFAPVSDASV